LRGAVADKLAGEGLGAENTGNLIQIWRIYGIWEGNKYEAGHLLSQLAQQCEIS